MTRVSQSDNVVSLADIITLLFLKRKEEVKITKHTKLLFYRDILSRVCGANVTFDRCHTSYV